MKDYFVAKDFDELIMIMTYAHKCAAATIANAKLQKLIESSPVVYTNGAQVWYEEITRSEDTHKARLICIEEVKKEPCKHRRDTNYPLGEDFCDNCGIELVATWEAKK